MVNIWTTHHEWLQHPIRYSRRCTIWQVYMIEWFLFTCYKGSYKYKLIPCGPPMLLFTLPKFYPPTGCIWTTLRSPSLRERQLYIETQMNQYVLATNPYCSSSIYTYPQWKRGPFQSESERSLNQIARMFWNHPLRTPYTIKIYF